MITVIIQCYYCLLFLFKIDTTRFKVLYDRREVSFEDSQNGSKFWEDVFRRFPNMKYYAPKAQRSVAIDFQDFMGIENNPSAGQEKMRE
jgi:hypothetical protein